MVNSQEASDNSTVDPAVRFAQSKEKGNLLVKQVTLIAELRSDERWLPKRFLTTGKGTIDKSKSFAGIEPVREEVLYG